MAQRKLWLEVDDTTDLDVTLREYISSFLEKKVIVDSSKPVIKNPNDPASVDQRNLMTKLKIRWDEKTTKAEASRLIGEKLGGDKQ